MNSPSCKILVVFASLIWSISGGFHGWPMLAASRQLFEQFSDRLIPNQELNVDGYSSRSVEHLGRLIKLESSVDEYTLFSCKFDIQTRTKESRHEMRPDLYCLESDLCGEFHFDLKKLKASEFDPRLRTIILISGFRSSDRADWFENVAKLWLEAENVNIIKVSWEAGNLYRYGRAVAGTPIVARQTTILLHHLAGLHGLQFTDSEFAGRVQIVGHSLGAHIAAFVGQDLGGRLGRITGLDPAGPFFDKQPRSRRLDSSDARLVDVIHTNGGRMEDANLAAPGGFYSIASNLLGWSWLKMQLGEAAYSRDADTRWFGIEQQVGHIDYYANDGRVQPGCESGYLHICDHGRSTAIYEDLLQHEVRGLRLAAGNQRRRRESRLVAIRADDYDSFRAGASLASELARRRPLETIELRRELEAAVRRRQLPIDLLTPIDELVGEYGSTKYGIKCGNGSGPSADEVGSKYFFSTRSERPLVGNHYLLKIKLAFDKAWTANCSMKAEITMPSGLVTKIDLAENLAGFINNGLSSGDDRFDLSAIFAAPAEEPANYSSWEDRSTADRARAILPWQVKLTINGWQRSSSILRALGNQIWSFISIESGLSRCSLAVDSIEIMPLMNLMSHAFFGLYDGRYSSPTDLLSAGGDSLTRNLSAIIL